MDERNRLPDFDESVDLLEGAEVRLPDDPRRVSVGTRQTALAERRHFRAHPFGQLRERDDSVAYDERRSRRRFGGGIENG
jgi:hypothetical protein